MKYTNREDIGADARKRYEAIAAIYGGAEEKRKTVSNVELMVEINNIISEYVQIEQAAEGIAPSRQFNISQIDFDLLRREFARAKKKNLVMKDLEDLIRVRLDAMLFNNPTASSITSGIKKSSRTTTASRTGPLSKKLSTN